MFAPQAQGLDQEPEAARATTRSAAKPSYGPSADLLGPRAGDGRDDDHDSDAFAATAMDDEEDQDDSDDDQQDEDQQNGGFDLISSLCVVQT